MNKIALSQAEKRVAVIEKRYQAIKNENNAAAEVARNKSAKLKALRLHRGYARIARAAQCFTEISDASLSDNPLVLERRIMPAQVSNQESSWTPVP